MIFLVRLLKTHEIVGIFAVESEDELWEQIDECTDVAYCEAREVENLSVYWSGPSYPIPHVHTDDGDEDGFNYLAGATFSEGTENAIVEKNDEWRRLVDGNIYLIKAGDRYKIGFSINIQSRIESLKTGTPYPIELLHWFPGDRHAEKRLHERYAAYRRHGEWFDLPDDIVQKIMDEDP